MADESEDETCDQTRQTSPQEDKQDKLDEQERQKKLEEPAHRYVKEEKQDKLDKQEALGQKKLEEPVHQHIDPGKSSSSTSGKKIPTKKVAAVIAAGVVAGAVGLVAAPLIAGAALGVAGFTSAGVAAGSIAAAAQSAIGSVAAGSLFAACQSAGAAGVIGAATTAGIGGAAGLGAAGAATGALKLFEDKQDELGKQKGQEKLEEKGSDTIHLVICGSSNGAYVFAGLASSLKGTYVRVLRLGDAMQKKDLKVTFHRKGKKPDRIVSKPALVTANLEEAMRDADIVVFMLPTYSLKDYLKVLKPHIKPGLVMVGLPWNPGFEGFEEQVRLVLGDTDRQCTIMNFESLPWACHDIEPGVKYAALGTMTKLPGTMKIGDVPPKKDPVATLQYLLGPLPKLVVTAKKGRRVK